MKLSKEAHDDLSLWMQYGKLLAHKHPELDELMINATYPIFREYYVPLGIDPDGNPIRKEK